MNYEDVVRASSSKLESANKAFQRIYPGDSEAVQPVQTLYGGAHLFKSETIEKIGELSRKHLQTYAPDAKAFSEALQLSVSKEMAETIYARVNEKLKAQAVEDFRIDFEDGYGNRPDAEEDETARVAAAHLAEGMEKGVLSPFIGIRIKPLNEELKNRSFRTLGIFMN